MEQKQHVKNTYQDKQVVDEFDSTRKRFAFQRYKHNIETNFLKQTIAKFTNEIKVLDVACGTGRMFKEIAPIDNVMYYGIDTSQEMMSHLKEASRKIKRDAWLSVGDATNLPYDNNTFDIVYSYHLTWHLPIYLQLEMIDEMMRVVKPGGYIIFDILNNNFVYEKYKSYIGKEKLKDIYKISPSIIEAVIELNKEFGDTYIEKLNDFPIKNTIFYNMVNIINLSRNILPNNMFHMLYYRIQKV